MELFSTLLAFELLEVHMPPLVVKPVSICYKAFRAQSTLERFLTSMGPLMIDPTGLILERLTTIGLLANKYLHIIVVNLLSFIRVFLFYQLLILFICLIWGHIFVVLPRSFLIGDSRV